MTEIEVRPLRPSDEPGLARFRDAIPEGERRFFKQDPGSLDQLPLSRGRWLVAIDGAEARGASPPPCRAAAGHLERPRELAIVVAPSHRGRGLGRELARRALREAFELGCTHAYVEVVAAQEALVAMFQDLGFAPEALLADFVRDADGVQHDLMVLTHRVSDSWARMDLLGVGAGGVVSQVRDDWRGEIRVRGQALHVSITGSGPPVLVINGLGGSLGMLSDLRDELSGHQVIKFDAPGTGKSPAPWHIYGINWVARSRHWISYRRWGAIRLTSSATRSVARWRSRLLGWPPNESDGSSWSRPAAAGAWCRDRFPVLWSPSSPYAITPEPPTS